MTIKTTTFMEVVKNMAHQAGQCRTVLVPVPDFMAKAKAHADSICDDEDAQQEFGRDGHGRPCFRIDECMVEALEAVWGAGYRTLGCCCGHGQDAGGIITIDTGSFSAEPRTGTQERFKSIHDRNLGPKGPVFE